MALGPGSYIYIYIYTSVNPCITCTKQNGAEQKLMPIKDEQKAALFDRPFRTQETNAPHGCGFERHSSSICGCIEIGIEIRIEIEIVGDQLRHIQKLVCILMERPSTVITHSCCKSCSSPATSPIIREEQAFLNDTRDVIKLHLVISPKPHCLSFGGVSPR